MVIVVNPVVLYNTVAGNLGWIIGQQEYQNTARIIVNLVVFNKRIYRVFDLDPGNIAMRDVVTNGNIF